MAKENWVILQLRKSQQVLAARNATAEALNEHYRTGFLEIRQTMPIACDGNPQGDYACDIHQRIAIEALGKTIEEPSETVAVVVARYLKRAQVAEAENKAMREALEAIERDFEKEPVQCTGEWETGLFCGLEDMDIVDRYQACRHGYDKALDKVREWIIDGLKEALFPPKEQGEPK